MLKYGIRVELNEYSEEDLHTLMLECTSKMIISLHLRETKRCTHFQFDLNEQAFNAVKKEFLKFYTIEDIKKIADKIKDQLALPIKEVENALQKFKEGM